MVTETQDAVAGKTTTTQYLQNFAKGSRPDSITTIERQGFAKETLHYYGFGYLHRSRQGEVLHQYARNQWGQITSYLVTDHDLVLRDVRSQYDDSGKDRKSTRLNSSHVRISY